MSIGISIGAAAGGPGVAPAMGYLAAINLRRKPLQNAIMAHSRGGATPTGGPMEVDYLGNYHAVGPGELPSRGMRIFRQERVTDIVTDVGFTSNASASGDDITLTAAGNSYYYLNSKRSYSAGTTILGRITIACAAGARDVGMRMNDVATGSDQQLITATVGPTPVDVYFAVTLTTASTMTFGIDLRSFVTATGQAAGTFTVTNPSMQIARPGQTQHDTETVTLGVITPEMLGPDEVANGTFETDSDWTKGAGWTISGGAAHQSGSASLLTNSQTVESGATYLVGGVVSGRTTGTLYARLGSQLSDPITANGAFERVVFANGTTVAAQSGTGFDGSIDGFYAKRLNYHGWGADGLAKFDTDEYGNPLSAGVGPVIFQDDFSSNTGWALTNAAIGGGEMAFSPAATAARAIGLVVGKTYEITYTVTQIVPGAASVTVYCGSQGAGIGRTAVGTFTQRIKCAGAPALYFFTGGAFVSGSIDNVSVREVYPVACVGPWLNVAITNRLTQNQDAASWTARAAANAPVIEQARVTRALRNLINSMNAEIQTRLPAKPRQTVAAIATNVALRAQMVTDRAAQAAIAADGSKTGSERQAARDERDRLVAEIERIDAKLVADRAWRDGYAELIAAQRTARDASVTELVNERAELDARRVTRATALEALRA